MLINLPRKYTEAEAAEYLTVSISLLRRERKDGNIGFVRLGKSVYYLEKHIIEYLERKECQTSDSKSVTTGYQSSGVAKIGAQRGLTAPPDKQSAHRSALAILKKPSKG